MKGGSSIEHDLFGDVFIFIGLKNASLDNQKSAINSLFQVKKEINPVKVNNNWQILNSGYKKFHPFWKNRRTTIQYDYLQNKGL
jgi:hypothetical protein